MADPIPWIWAPRVPYTNQDDWDGCFIKVEKVESIQKNALKQVYQIEPLIAP